MSCLSVEIVLLKLMLTTLIQHLTFVVGIVMAPTGALLLWAALTDPEFPKRWFALVMSVSWLALGPYLVAKSF